MPDIHTIGAALYGRHWQSDMADDLGVSARTVRRWAAGQPVPDSVLSDLAQIAKRRADTLRKMSRDIKPHPQ